MDKCPDCNGNLETGCMLDHTYGAVIAQRYARANISETPQKMIAGAYEADFNDVRRVVTYRCTKCNRLFQYAQNIVLIPNLRARQRSVMIVVIGVLLTMLLALVLVLFSARGWF